MNWQSIDTAPKDGTPVLLYDASCEDWAVGSCTGIDYDGTKLWHLSVSETLYVSFCENEYVLTPTHWMPLPEPPKPSIV